MEIGLLRDIIIICGLALGVIYICHRLKIPTIVGFLLTGLVAGPHGMALVRQTVEVEQLAEVGVVCLLFTIGLEFSLKRLLQIKFWSLVGGGCQVGLTLFMAALAASVMGLALNQAVFFGFLVSLSSTAIVLKIIQERAEMESPHGRLTVGILLFQDIIVVPMMLIAPILAGGRQDLGMALLLLVVKAAAVLCLVVAASRWIVPSALYQIARLRAKELFILGIVLIGLGVAWLTAQMGLSLALGAFLAGLIVSESEFSHRALGNVLPFRDLFTSIFFVSIGMLLDVQFVLGNPVLLVTAAIGTMVLKFLTAGVSASLLGLPLRTTVLTGLSLAQIGEFSFVLSEAGIQFGLIEPGVYQVFLGLSVLTMVATPFLIGSGDRLATASLRLPLPERLKSGFSPVSEIPVHLPLANHLVIVGFGLNGRNLSRAAALGKIPRIIIELNAETVRREQAQGEPIFYGDASHESVLEHAAIKQARVMVIVISDPVATRRIIDSARRLNPKLHVIARTRFVSEMEPLYELGADEVIPEDYEASIEVLVRVLAKYLVPKGDIERLVMQFRTEHYRMLRTLSLSSTSLPDLEIRIPEVEIVSLRVCPGSEATGKTLRELNLRAKYGMTVVAIRRQDGLILNPSADERLATGDVCMALITPDRITDAAAVFGDLGPGVNGF
ncbi:MAG: cation:proton antiporter [Desulfomonile tiedjei]|nr:cation:proton antiporter [Desulfomonile tiedjei]